MMRMKRVSGGFRFTKLPLSRSAAAPALLAAFLCAAMAQAAQPSPACAGFKQKAAALSGEDLFEANLLLFSAAGGGCEDLVRGLLARGVALDARDRLGRTALALAAKQGRDHVAALLLARGAAVNGRAISGATPLFFAAEGDHASTARLLIAHGADVSLTGAGGLTPLMAAAFNGNAELTDLLIGKGADPDARDASGKAAILYAASRGFTRVVARLIEAGSDVDGRYEHGLTALMWAAGYADGAGLEDIKEVVALLLARGASLDIGDDRGKTALDIARDLGHREIADYLAAQSPAR
jgi:ankyrin repeat protein